GCGGRSTLGSTPSAGKSLMALFFWWTVLYLFTSMGALFPMLVNGPSSFRNFVEDPSPLIHVVYLLTSAPFLLIALLRPGRALGALRYLILPVIIALCGVLSVSYSTAPMRSAV